MMNKKYWNLASIIFNVLETVILILMAWWLKIGIVNTLIIFFTFQISRFYFKFPKHYKDWRKCLIWTCLIFSSMFIIAKINIAVGCLCTIFCAYILSDNADIRDMYMWRKNNESKYKALEDYIKYKRLCDNHKLIDIEKQLAEDDSELYVFYKRRFIEGKTFREISEEFDIDNPRIVEKLDKVYLIFKYALKL